MTESDAQNRNGPALPPNFIPLSKTELMFVTSVTAPLFWREGAGRAARFRNGSTSFVDGGQGVFGVTADHVVAGWQERRASGLAGQIQLAAGSGHESLPIDFNACTIDRDQSIDILTFKIRTEDVAAIGASVLRGMQSLWPPPPPVEGQGVVIGGYPGAGTRVEPDALCFGAAPATLVASSVNERDISCLLERQYTIGILGQGIPPENFVFGGISGGPMLSKVEHSGVVGWNLAGVIYEGPNVDGIEGQSISGMDIIRARRAHFILPDGTLDRQRWAASSFR